MSLSKTNYESVAAIIALSDTKEDIIKGLIAYFIADNQNFDTTRFLVACGWFGSKGNR